MGKTILLLTAVFICFIYSGCSTIDTGTVFTEQGIVTTNAKPIANINANNYGYYLFCAVPIWTGNPNSNGSSLFSNQVTLEKVMGMVIKKSKELGAIRVVDLQSNVIWSSGWSLGLIGFKEVQVSGNAVR
jgi:hypothetical protein